MAFWFSPTLAHAESPIGNYAVVISQKTYTDPAWTKIADLLKTRHKATVIVYDKNVNDAIDALKKLHPRYTCFVAKSTEAGRQFVADVHTLTRRFDDDPYTDTLWGILTGFDADCAMKIVQMEKPLVIRRTAAATEIALDMCEEGICYDELVKGKVVRKEKGGSPILEKGPDDTTAALIETLEKYKADLFVTSGHATERNWMLGFRYRNGYFKSQGGQMFGEDTKKNKIAINTSHPRVLLAVGNCLMAHINGPDAMALAWMNDCGVRQMVGYTVPSWYGYSGWGCLDYFVEQPGRYTLAEAFHANHHALIHRMTTYFPKLGKTITPPGQKPKTKDEGNEKAKAAGLSSSDGVGLLYDRDVIAFYGDPCWSATMANAPKAWEQKLTEKDGVYTFTIEPCRGKETFQPINTNGSQRGGRPIIEFFPRRLTNIELLEGDDLQPVIADDFLLVPNPGECNPNRTYQIRFKAKEVIEPAR